MSAGAYVAKGSPATLIVVDGSTGYVVDPGYPPKRGKLLRKALKKLGVGEVVAILTHAHGDHVAALETLEPDEVYVHPAEIGSALIPECREALALGYPFHAKTDLMLFEPVSARRAKPLGSGVGPIEAIPLPGHTFGHTGLLFGKLLYVGDAVFGEKLLSKVGVPYFADHRAALASMELLLERVKGGEALLLSHGPLASGHEAARLVELNIERLAEVRRLVLSLLRGAMSDYEVAYAVLQHLGGEVNPTALLLATVTVRSVLAELYEEGLIEPCIDGKRLAWRLARQA